MITVKEAIKNAVDLSPRIALVVSRFNQAITEKLLEGVLKRLSERTLSADRVDTFWVPGAVEIPLVAQSLAETQKYKAIIALGAVIRGETTHYELVCEQVSQGCQRISLNYNIPVIFGVVTTENKAQAVDRVGGIRGHKGEEAADAALEMINLLHTIESESLRINGDK